MEKFIKGIDEGVISKEVKDAMLKAKSFKRVLVQVVEGAGVGSYTVNEFDAHLSTITPEKVVEIMGKEGFSITVENREFRLHHKEEKEDNMNQKDIAYFLFDRLER